LLQSRIQMKSSPATQNDEQALDVMKTAEMEEAAKK
jgi:hypothetical protein